MIGSTRIVKVQVFATPVDMRKSFDTLSFLVTNEFKRDLLSGELFLFVGKSRRRAKVLYFDGTGLCLFSKRLEVGRFATPWRATAPLTWTMTELALFFEGSLLVGKTPLSPSPLVLLPL